MLVLISHGLYLHDVHPDLVRVLRWLPSGGHGVHMFFVISGFLITYLLIREWELYQEVNIRAFYLRRTLRIVPAYLFFLLVIFIVYQFKLPVVDGLSWLPLLTYTINYVSNPGVVEHIWSLSVEEQFYLLWPALFIFSMKYYGFKGAFFASLIPVFLCPIIRVAGYVYDGGWILGKTSIIMVGDALAWGCFSALLIKFYGRFIAKLVRRHVNMVLLVSVIVFYALYLPQRLHIGGVITVPFASSMTSFAFVLIIYAGIFNAIHPFFSPP